MKSQGTHEGSPRHEPGASSWAACVAPGVFRKHGDSLSGERAARKAPWRLTEVPAPTIRHGRGRESMRDSACCAGPPAHSGSCGDLCGPVGPVGLNTPRGRRTCGRKLKREEQRHVCGAEGVVSKPPGGEPGERRGRRPLFVFDKNRKTFVFILARRDAGGRS